MVVLPKDYSVLQPLCKWKVGTQFVVMNLPVLSVLWERIKRQLLVNVPGLARDDCIFFAVQAAWNFILIKCIWWPSIKHTICPFTGAMSVWLFKCLRGWSGVGNLTCQCDMITSIGIIWVHSGGAPGFSRDQSRILERGWAWPFFGLLCEPDLFMSLCQSDCKPEAVSTFFFTFFYSLLSYHHCVIKAISYYVQICNNSLHSWFDLLHLFVICVFALLIRLWCSLMACSSAGCLACWLTSWHSPGDGASMHVSQLLWW